MLKPFEKLALGAERLYLAAPYFTKAEPILEAASKGKSVQLLIGLNEATSPQALAKLQDKPGVAVRYLTSRFHAKIFIFDDCALLGSSNLTDGGLISNREAVICLDQPEDADAVEEIRSLFLELWDAGHVLTKEKLDKFTKTHADLRRRRPNAEKEIEDALGKAEPPNVNVASHEKSKERIFLESLRQQVYEQYRPAFNEVTAILEEGGYRREDLADVGIANETNRFLNYIRRSHVFGDEAWRNAPLRTPDARQIEIEKYAREWVSTPDNKVPEDYASWLLKVKRVFGSREAIQSATKEDITEGLMSLHAFLEQLRFVKGGAKNLPPEFWKRNSDNIDRVKTTITHLVHGSGDFIQRLHDVIYDPAFKLALFGRFCALELYGTIKPEECPPMNGRMAKALRFLGFDVKGT